MSAVDIIGSNSADYNLERKFRVSFWIGKKNIVNHFIRKMISRHATVIKLLLYFVYDKYLILITSLKNTKIDRVQNECVEN